MIDPRMPSDPVAPAYATQGRVATLVAEIWDHVWPWSRQGFQRQATLSALGLALGLAASLMWLLAAQGRLEAGAIIAWWAGWSVLEVMIRLASKPYVKEGPWWGRQYRRAGRMDMVCYVGFKNLLIGASLFLLLKSFGLVTLTVVP